MNPNNKKRSKDQKNVPRVGGKRITRRREVGKVKSCGEGEGEGQR
jgi:hypothetical protein